MNGVRFEIMLARALGALCAIALSVGMWPHALAAQAATPEPAAAQLLLGGELGYFGDAQQASTLHLISLRLFGEYALDARWSFAADFGLVMLDSVPDRGASDTVLRPGNPALMARMRDHAGPIEYTLGLGGAAPLAVIERGGAGRLHHTAYTRVQGMRGLADVWLWAPSRGALLGLVRAGLAASPWLRVEAEVAPALMLPARDAFGYYPVDLFVPVALSVAAKVSALTPGLRTQVVLMTTGPDALQLSFQPWLRLALSGGYLELRYTANVGEPLVGERGPGSWGLHLGAGGTL